MESLKDRKIKLYEDLKITMKILEDIHLSLESKPNASPKKIQKKKKFKRLAPIDKLYLVYPFVIDFMKKFGFSNKIVKEKYVSPGSIFHAITYVGQSMRKSGDARFGITLRDDVLLFFHEIFEIILQEDPRVSRNELFSINFITNNLIWKYISYSFSDDLIERGGKSYCFTDSQIPEPIYFSTNDILREAHSFVIDFFKSKHKLSKMIINGNKLSYNIILDVFENYSKITSRNDLYIEKEFESRDFDILIAKVIENSPFFKPFVSRNSDILIAKIIENSPFIKPFVSKDSLKFIDLLEYFFKKKFRKMLIDLKKEIELYNFCKIKKVFNKKFNLPDVISDYTISSFIV